MTPSSNRPRSVHHFGLTNPAASRRRVRPRRPFGIKFEVLEERRLLSTATWTGGDGNNSWDDPYNWLYQNGSSSGPGVPDADSVTTIGANQGTILLGNNETAGFLNCGAGSTLDVGSNWLTLTAGATLDGTITL